MQLASSGNQRGSDKVFGIIPGLPQSGPALKMTAIADSLCFLLVLHQGSLAQVLERFPEEREKVLSAAPKHQIFVMCYKKMR